MRRLVTLALVAGSGLAAAPASREAVGTFAVTVTPEAEAAAPIGGRATARLAIVKQFTGALQGTATGTMIAVGSPGQSFAGYVVLDQFTGRLEGRKGGFVLLHRGSMTGPSDMHMDVQLAPGSGTGDLAGIAGSMTIAIDGTVHRYRLRYTLPGSR